MPVVAIPHSNMNVRQGPGTNYPVIGAARAGQAYPITGRNAAGDWWRIEYLGQPGWLYALLTETQGDIAGIPVVTEIPSASQPSPTATATPAPELPELDLALSADPPWAVPGRMLTFRLTVHNGGDSDAGEVTARDELPSLVTLHEASSSQGEVILEGQVVLARLGTLRPGATAIITITGAVVPDAPLGGIIDNLAEVASAEGFWQSVGVSVPLPPAELPPTGARFPDSD
ncbi:MAG: SH3 domain-containing protein [Anaerolineae bacterium]|nr:SH3 domain-containing protein [Anaerolineae bacterium]